MNKPGSYNSQFSPEENIPSREQTDREILEHLSELTHLPSENIPRSSSLLKDLGLDSLDKVELLMWCEITFKIAINDDGTTEIDTVGDVMDVVHNLMNPL